MAAIATAAPLIASGPPGWIVLGVLGVATIAVTAAAIISASNDADESLSEGEPDGVTHCPEQDTETDESATTPRDYPANPDDLPSEGYDEISHPEAAKNGVRRFRDRKTGDEIEFHKGKSGEPGWGGRDHWHRFNPNATSRKDAMLDRNGQPVPKGSNPSHLEPR